MIIQSEWEIYTHCFLASSDISCWNFIHLLVCYHFPNSVETFEWLVWDNNSGFCDSVGFFICGQHILYFFPRYVNHISNILSLPNNKYKWCAKFMRMILKVHYLKKNHLFFPLDFETRQFNTGTYLTFALNVINIFICWFMHFRQAA